MRSSPQWISACAGLALWLLLAPRVSPGQEAPPLADAYRADVLPPVRGRAVGEIQLLFARGSAPAPRGLTWDLEARVREEWPEAGVYGRVHSALGLWLHYPLVTAQVSGRLLVPVVDGDRLPIEGELSAALDDPGPRRVVVLVDASASANALTPPSSEPGVQRIAVLEAERRALGHLLRLARGPVELGVIAFGEGTWPVAEPGLPEPELRRRLERFGRERPRGQGRTDVVCALWTAWDWLESTPEGVGREIVLLTDGELPHSGRFTDCDAREGGRLRSTRESCEEGRNRSPCPAAARLRSAEGNSDLAQLAAFSRRVRGAVRITPLVFDLERGARVWEQLARRSGSSLIRIPAPEAIEAVLPALVSQRIRAVHAHNAATGETTPDLLAPGGRRFAGALRLRPGANDVELRVASDAGLAALFRFRVYSEPGYLQRQLGKLRRENASLQQRARQIGARFRPPGPPERAVEVEVPAAIAPAAQ